MKSRFKLELKKEIVIVLLAVLFGLIAGALTHGADWQQSLHWL